MRQISKQEGRIFTSVEEKEAHARKLWTDFLRSAEGKKFAAKEQLHAAELEEQNVSADLAMRWEHEELAAYLERAASAQGAAHANRQTRSSARDALMGVLYAAKQAGRTLASERWGFEEMEAQAKEWQKKFHLKAGGMSTYVLARVARDAQLASWVAGNNSDVYAWMNNMEGEMNWRLLIANMSYTALREL